MSYMYCLVTHMSNMYCIIFAKNKAHGEYRLF